MYFLRQLRGPFGSWEGVYGCKKYSACSAFSDYAITDEATILRPLFDTCMRSHHNLPLALTRNNSGFKAFFHQGRSLKQGEASKDADVIEERLPS